MQVYKNVNLQAYHTFGIEVFTEAFAVLENREDLFELKSLILSFEYPKVHIQNVCCTIWNNTNKQPKAPEWREFG